MDDQTRNTLDPQVTETLKRILAKDLVELTDHDKAFLRARKSYVGRSSREKFASVFDEVPQEKPAEPENVEEKSALVEHPYTEDDGEDEEQG